MTAQCREIITEPSFHDHPAPGTPDPAPVKTPLAVPTSLSRPEKRQLSTSSSEPQLKIPRGQGSSSPPPPPSAPWKSPWRIPTVVESKMGRSTNLLSSQSYGERECMSVLRCVGEVWEELLVENWVPHHDHFLDSDRDTALDVYTDVHVASPFTIPVDHTAVGLLPTFSIQSGAPHSHHLFSTRSTGKFIARSLRLLES